MVELCGYIHEGEYDGRANLSSKITSDYCRGSLKLLQFGPEPSGHIADIRFKKFLGYFFAVMTYDWQDQAQDVKPVAYV